MAVAERGLAKGETEVAERPPEPAPRPADNDTNQPHVEALRAKLYGIVAILAALFLAAFVTMLVQWYVFRVALVHPQDALYGSLAGLGWLATALCGMFSRRKAHGG